jgi:ABC-type Mn2+/Zn2+ transport system ATPase subunit/ABC-type Zn uptake system ZnuABC Zn-binding protein ZnuA
MAVRILKLIYIFIIAFTSTLLADKKFKVVCTTTIIFDITQNIAKNKHEIKCLMPVGGDPHIYEPTPGDAKVVADADLILKNGLFLEGWLDELINNAISPDQVIMVSDGIEPIKSDNIHQSPDPHVWMNPLNGIIFAENIKNTFCRLDEENKAFYESNFNEYAQKLRKTDKYIQSQISKIPTEKRVLITSHDAFKYFGLRYGINVQAAMGTSTDAEVQIADINKLIETIKVSKVDAIFVETTINPKLIGQIAADQGIKIGGKLFADSLGEPNSESGTYIGMLTYNVNVISNALVNSKNNFLLENIQLIALLGSAIFLFVWAFIWLFVKIKPLKKSNLDWDKYQIEVRNLTVTYERKTVLSNINFALDSGKLYGLLGPNGAGKSTLFKSILGLIKPDTGIVLINGQEVGEIRDKIAYIPQKEEIDWSFPATVFDIVLTGRLPIKKQFEMYSIEDNLKAKQAIEKMGLTEFSKRKISDLSGGQQQRVFIARALCQEAEVLFFDEPFVGVDITTEEKIIFIIKKLVQEQKTVIMIHHDLSKVKEYFDQIIMVNQRLITFGSTPEVFNNENITKTYGGRLAILQESDKYVF